MFFSADFTWFLKELIFLRTAESRPRIQAQNLRAAENEGKKHLWCVAADSSTGFCAPKQFPIIKVRVWISL